MRCLILGAIYLKNLTTANWAEPEPEHNAPIPFSIHEQDRSTIRSLIVEAIIHAPELIRWVWIYFMADKIFQCINFSFLHRLQLSTCINCIIKHDFPGRWTEIVDKIHIYLQNLEAEKIYGALLCLYQLVKNFEWVSDSRIYLLMKISSFVNRSFQV